MNISKMTYNQFLKLPKIDRNSEIQISSAVIIPMPEKHDSGYNTIALVLISESGIFFLSDGFDVLAIDGISTAMNKSSGWRIECLQNGFLQLFRSGGKKFKLSGFSTLEIIAQD